MVYWFINFLFLFHPHISFISPSAHRLHLHLHSPILFLLPSSPLLYCLPVHEYEPPSISFLPSLIYILHRFFFPLLFTLSSLFYRRGSGCGSGLWLWFPIVGPVLFSDCDRRGRRPLGYGSLLSVFFPLLFALSSLFYRRRSGCGSGLWLWFSIVGLVLFSDCDWRGHRPLGCGSLLSDFFFSPFVRSVLSVLLASI